MQTRRTLLVSLSRENEELEDLAYAGGLEVAETFVQRRRSPDPRTFLGSGALERLAQQVQEDGGYEVCLVAAALRATQVLRLQKALGLEVWDRTRLILEIFADRASSEEARLQVELARHEYELPLVREAIHIEKSGERPGFMAGGEMGFVEYQNHLRGRMARIRSRLEAVSRERKVRRADRRRGGMWLVALAGYTNAGKSTLLNALTEGGAVAENRLFSTLATRTRRVTFGGPSSLLLTDTVGFIEDLPPWMVDAFHATLEEVALADVVLLVVDSSDALPEIERKALTSLRTLRQLRADLDASRPERVLLVLNKADACPHSPEELMDLAERLGLAEHALRVAARRQWGLEPLMERVRAAIDDRLAMQLFVPATDAGRRLLGWLERQGELRVRAVDDGFECDVGVRPDRGDKVRAEAARAGATWEPDDDTAGAATPVKDGGPTTEPQPE